MSPPPRLSRWLDRLDRFLVIARLSLFVAIVNNHSHPTPAILIGVVTAVLYFNDRWIRSPWPWLLLVAVLGSIHLQEWWLVDDHPVATTYWLLAIGMSRFARRPDDVLALSGRVILGALFTLAFGWKVLSGPFVDGDFFEYTIVRDDRFEPIAVVVGGAQEDDLARERAMISEFTSTASAGQSIDIDTGDRTRSAALTFTWVGLIMEGAVAAAFLAPLRGHWRALRAVTLIGFCITTYAVLPIAGFAVLLLTMGLAQARQAAMRSAYVISAVAILIWNTTLAALIL